MQSVELIRETEDFAAFYKPAGLVFHEDSPRTDFLDEMRALCRDQADRLFPVHRLDRVTSGVLLCAKGRKNANLLGNEFRFNRAEKVYVALSTRPGFKKAGLIVGDMEKGRGGAYKLLRSKENPARTSFVSESLQEQRAGLRLFWVRPITGKTHQIRVALKSVGFSILGDPLYNAFSEARKEDRTYLHALSLRFELQGKTFTIKQIPLEGEEFLNPLCLETIKELADPYSLDYPGMRIRPSRTHQISGSAHAGKRSKPPSNPGARSKAKASGPPSSPGARSKAKASGAARPGAEKKHSEKTDPAEKKQKRKRQKPRQRKGNPPGSRHSP